jgi:hypothetical protein
MSTRVQILRSGEIVEWDEAGRNPRLIGNLVWPELRPESPLKLPNGRRISTRDWNDSGWAELVADCPCEECQAQRAAALN